MSAVAVTEQVELDGPPRKVLILRLGALGDVVFLLPCLSLLRRAWPEAELHWMVKAPYVDLLAENPALTKVWPFRKGARGLIEAAASLRDEGFDLVLDYHANLRSGVLSKATGCRQRVGFARPHNKEMNSLFNRTRVALPEHVVHKVERNLYLTRCLPGVAEDGRPELFFAADRQAEARVEGCLAEGAGPLLLVHPGSSSKGAIKRWFLERYAEVLEVALGAGARVMLLWGDRGERDRALEVAERVGRRDLVVDERLSLRELIALFRRASLYLGVDSGPLHLANAVGLDVLGLYGPKAPEIYRPYHGAPGVLARNDEVGCPPCNATRCHNPEGRVCLEALSARDVASEVLLRLGLERLSVSHEGR